MSLLPTSRPRRLVASVSGVLALLAGALVAGAVPASPATAELFFSEYVEGSSNNKALEVFNGTGSAVDLTVGGYSVQVYFNGSATASLTVNLSGSVADDDVFVLAQSSASAPVLAQADQTNGAAWFNGDDAVVLRKGTTILDVIGQVGADPGSEWGSGLASTADNTLRRQPGVLGGDTDGSDTFAPSTQWEGFPTDTFTGLGSHSVTEEETAPSVTSTTPSAGANNVAISSNISIAFSEPVDVAGDWFSVSCSRSGTHAATVSGGPSTYEADPAGDFSAGETCTVTVEGDSVTDQDTQDPPDGMAADYTWSFSTAPPAPSCSDPQTHLVSQVQGSGAATEVPTSEDVTVQAVVTAIRPGLSGFFIQEEASDQDGSAATSEGVFVRATPPATVAVGDAVQVTGGVREFTGFGSSQTQISVGVTVLDCGVAGLPPAAALQFPVTEVTDFEHFEGMRVTMPQALVISEFFNFARFNEVVVGLPPNGRARFDTPTAVQEPGTASTSALLADYAKRRITIDDGRGSQNSSPPILPGTVNSPFTLDNTFRGGDTLTGITGVVEHTFGLYRVHPTEDATYASTNPRPAGPPEVGGEIKVASFNVLNYFLTLDNGRDDICSPGRNQECRGADNEDERLRQRAKTVDAITRLDADVVGLMEMENTPGVEPAADLVEGLNAATAPGTYAFVDTGVIGTDAIRLGFLYRPGAVAPVGGFEVLDSSDDPRFDDTRSRPALAQTFEQVGTTEQVTVAVNHLKSKGSSCAGDPDLGDGSGSCNLTRTRAAQALADWLQTDPTASGDPDRLVIGDLNSYDHEAPVDALTAAGYTDLAKEFGGEFAYSYVFDGQVGYLDHGLASQSLAPQVTGAAEWHINADEPAILDYDTSFKGPNEDALYEPNAFRSSDHDPVVLGLDLGRCSFTDDAASKVRSLDGDCSTSTTVGVPDGWTLDGAGHTITAYDGEGDHFLGAVVANDGAVANVSNLTVTAYDLADVCDAGDDRLRGILLDGAAGSITDSTVAGLNQGSSGCQEGNAIEVRNAPFDTNGPDVTVTVSGNEVGDYQKTGVLVNGSVVARVLGNTVDGLGPVPYVAQNGIQVGFGATATVEGNTIADNWYAGTADAVSCGVLLFEADGVKQRRNTFAGNQRDLCNAGRGGGGTPAG